MSKLDQYLGNPNLKKAHTKSRFTKKQVDEVMKCLEDPKYFIENYLKITDNFNLDSTLGNFYGIMNYMIISEMT